jgi:predicted enzyme related to lactoylglutathione lyase
MYYLVQVPDSARAKTFYANVFEWSYNSRGDYHHIVGSSPGGGILGGAEIARITASFVVSDVEKAVRVTAERGGAATQPEQSRSGWSASVEDGRGESIRIWQPSEGFADPNPRCDLGDLYYFVVSVADDTAKEFYGAVLNWEYTNGHVPGGFNIVNTRPPGGMFVGGTGDVSLYFQVDDVEKAAERVREAGGTAGPTEPNSAGWHAVCTDDQGVEFSIGALR